MRYGIAIPKLLWILLSIAAIVGCGGTVAAPDPAPGSEASLPAAELKPVPATPIAIQKARLEEPTWDPAWDMLIEQALPNNLLSRRREKEVRALCPEFRHLNKGQRRAFWAYFFQALAGAEAGLNPASDVHHLDPQVDVVDDVTHRRVRQEGLLQLTYMDDRRYGCNFDWKRDSLLPEHDPEKSILLPENNLMCGLRIVEDQVIRRKKPLLNDNSYWSTLRPDNPSFAIFKKQMANVPTYCEEQPRESEPVNASTLPLVEASDEPSNRSQGKGTAESGTETESATRSSVDSRARQGMADFAR